MAYIQIPAFTKTNTLENDTEFVIVVDGVENLVTFKTLSDKFGNTPELLASIEAEITALRSIVDAFPTENPAAPIALKISDIPIIDGLYKPTEAGTYTNAGGLIYNPTEGVTYFIRTNGVWAKDVTPINFTPTGTVSQGNTEAVSGNEVFIKTIVGDNKTALEKSLSQSSNLIPDVSFFQNRLLTSLGTYPSTTNNAISIKHFPINDYKGQYITLSGLGGLPTNRTRYVILDQNNNVVQSAAGLGATNTNNVTILIPNSSESLTIALNVVEGTGTGSALVNGNSIYPSQVMINVGSIAIPFQNFGKYIDREKIGIPVTYGKIYLSSNGSDLEIGQTKNTAVKTFSRARKLLDEDGLLYIFGDFESPTEYDLSMFRVIIVPTGERCRLIYGAKYTEATLTSGYTRVYQVSHTGNLVSSFLWQWDIKDRNTLINTNDYLPIYRKKTHRNEHTRIYPASSIEEVESTTDKEMYFKDNANNILYFSKVAGSDLSLNPIRIYTTGGVLRASKDQNINITGIEIYLRAVYTMGLTGYVNRSVFALANGSGCLMWDYTYDLTFNDCEFYGALNDGVNGHYAGTITLNNCWSHDNVDDCESAHENCVSIINGGVYEYSGNGITPATGGSTYVTNALVRHNKNKSSGNPWANNEEGTGFSSQGGFLHVFSGLADSNMKNYNIQSGSFGRLDLCVSKTPIVSHLSGGGTIVNTRFEEIN